MLVKFEILRTVVTNLKNRHGNMRVLIPAQCWYPPFLRSPPPLIPNSFLFFMVNSTSYKLFALVVHAQR